MSRRKSETPFPASNTMLVLAMLEGGENAKAEAFYQALEGGAKPREDG